MVRALRDTTAAPLARHHRAPLRDITGAPLRDGTARWALGTAADMGCAAPQRGAYD